MIKGPFAPSITGKVGQFDGVNKILAGTITSLNEDRWRRSFGQVLSSVAESEGAPEGWRQAAEIAATTLTHLADEGVAVEFDDDLFVDDALDDELAELLAALN